MGWQPARVRRRPAMVAAFGSSGYACQPPLPAASSLDVFTVAPSAAAQLVGDAEADGLADGDGLGLTLADGLALGDGQADPS